MFLKPSNTGLGGGDGFRFLCWLMSSPIVGCRRIYFFLDILSRVAMIRCWRERRAGARLNTYAVDLGDIGVSHE